MSAQYFDFPGQIKAQFPNILYPSSMAMKTVEFSFLFFKGFCCLHSLFLQQDELNYEKIVVFLGLHCFHHVCGNTLFEDF